MMRSGALEIVQVLRVVFVWLKFGYVFFGGFCWSDPRVSGKDIYGSNMSKGPNYGEIMIWILVVHIDNIHYLMMKSQTLTKHHLIGSSIGQENSRGRNCVQKADISPLQFCLFPATT